MLALILIVANLVVSVIGFRNPAFFSKYLFNEGAILHHKEYYRIFTGGFLHAGWLHLGFNMITLYFFYQIPVEGLGETGFLLLYAGCLLLSGLWTLYIHRREPMYTAVGASGAVIGVVFSAIMLNPSLKLFIFPLPIPIPAYIFALGYLLYSLYGVRKNLGRIGHAAHLGGAAAGVLITVAIRPSVLSAHPWITIGLLAFVIVLFIFEYSRNRTV